MVKFFTYSVLVLLSVGTTHAQYYSNGADPASTDWWQIKTEQYQVIFPREYESQAQIFAAKMDYAYDFVVKSMQSKPRKLSIIIHTQTANSNGMVAWAPRRMELWTIPSQAAFNYAQEWMEQLIIHETRHFVQENKMNQGFTKVLKALLGEQAEMIPLGMMTRQWFMEGDAVVTETALSSSGRGRMPSFEQGLRALTLEKGKQGYDPVHLGTYRHYIPDHYEVGYHTVAVNRLYRDSAMFDEKMDDIGRFSTLRGFRDSRKMKYYGFAIDHLEKDWLAQDAALETTSFEVLTLPEKDYSSYTFLQEDEGMFYAIRHSLSDIPEIIQIDSVGVQRRVALRGWTAESDFSMYNGKLLFADNRPDSRWEQRSFADLFVVDLSTMRTKRLTNKQVLQSPNFSPDGNMIVAQRVDGNGVYALQILDANDGQVLRLLLNPNNQFYFSPKWSDDGTKIVYVAQEKDQKSLKYYNLETNEELLLVEGTYGEMAHPVWSEDKVYFTASYSGINNIYCCDVETKEVTRITSARFGADYATMHSGQLLYANYTSDGYRPVRHLSSAVAGENLSEVQNMSLGLGDKLTVQEGAIIDFSKAPTKNYEVINYARFKHLFHFHSWFPFLPVGIEDGSATDVEIDGFYPSINLLSQNKLSTSFLSASYDGNPANSSEKYRLSYDYNGFYPQLSLDVSWGDFQAYANVSTPSSTGYETVRVLTKVRDVAIRPSVSLPLSFKQGARSLYFTNQLFAEYVRLNYTEFNEQRNYFSRGFYTSFIRAQQSAVRDLYSPFRQDVSFLLSYEDGYISPYKLAAKAKLYFPGLGAHHSTQLGLNWQQKDVNTSNGIASLPRGYSSNINEQIVYASFDYFIPLGYPDVHLGSWVNIKRYSFGLYGDLAQIVDAVGDQNLIGGGGALFFDVNFLRYEVDVRLGVQYGVMAYSANSKLDYPFNFILNFSVF